MLEPHAKRSGALALQHCARGCDGITALEARCKLRVHRLLSLLIVCIVGISCSKDDGDQLRLYQSQFPLFWQPEYVHGITLWGWAYDNTGVTSWLVKDTTPRPAMTWLMQYLGRTTR
jgi:hypothetical protein